ncbi:redoxin family protein [Candidatus Parcubacteria bacterium]|nr:redoxin family protein [Candidatus Parcubacteria bacterium]
MLLLIVSFIAGILTILAPCVLPVLPVILGSSVNDKKANKKKTLTIIVSLGVSVILFTLLLKVSTLFIDIPEYIWKIVSGVIILILGLITIFPSLWENKFIAKLSRKSNIALGRGDQKKSFWGDVIVGASLGPVFSTCSPTYFIILATVLPVSLFLGVTYLLAYALGLCLALFAVALIGQRIVDKLGIAANPDGWFKKILGIIFVIVAIGIFTGADKKLQTYILDKGFFDVTKIEQNLLGKKAEMVNTAILSGEYLSIAEKEAKYKKVIELVSPDGYINTGGKPITLAELKGKVVLLDVWTYSCINCKRTIPYINEWYTKYQDKGFEVVGLHTPEFAFEKVQANVEKAVLGFNIKYPVVLDNNYQTWNALQNRYWPRKYLIDIDGYVIYDHIGEGAYEETEKAIQYALKERAERLGIDADLPTGIVNLKDQVTGKVNSPETYFGSARNTNLGSGKSGTPGVQNFTPLDNVGENKLFLNGLWNITPEYAENLGAADIMFRYDAKGVYMTAGSLGGVEVEIYKDDVLVKKIMIKDETLYTLIEGDDYGKHILKIRIPKAGLKAFTFTFG